MKRRGDTGEWRSCYRLRVHLRNGDTAWVSPIFDVEYIKEFLRVKADSWKWNRESDSLSGLFLLICKLKM